MNTIQKLSHNVDEHGIYWLINRLPYYTRKRVGKLSDDIVKKILRDSSNYGMYRFQYLQNSTPDDLQDYDVPIAPFRIMHVDPHRITRKSCRQWRPFEFRKKLPGKVTSGNWDRSPIRLHDQRLYRGFVQRFEKDMEWDETDLFDQPTDQLEMYDDLYADIRDSGYKCQQQLREESDIAAYTDIPLDRFYWESAQPSRSRSAPVQTLRRLLDEVLVDIGRNGELLYVDGKHRLCIAQILDIDKIPVVVAYRHKSWMEHLENAWEQNISSDWHPDLRQLQ